MKKFWHEVCFEDWAMATLIVIAVLMALLVVFLTTILIVHCATGSDVIFGVNWFEEPTDTTIKSHEFMRFLSTLKLI